MILRIFTALSLLVALSACSHHKYHKGMHKNMTAEQHLEMAKAHQDVATCLKDAKVEASECHKIMKEAKKKIWGEKSCCHMKKSDCKSGCQLKDCNKEGCKDCDKGGCKSDCKDGSCKLDEETKK